MDAEDAKLTLRDYAPRQNRGGATRLADTVAREKAAIEEVVSQIQIHLEQLHMSLSQQEERLNPILSQLPEEQDAVEGFPYLGSSSLYDSLHGVLNNIHNAHGRVARVTYRAEI